MSQSMHHVVPLIQLNSYYKYLVFKEFWNGRVVLQSMHHVVTLTQLHSYENYFVFIIY